MKRTKNGTILNLSIYIHSKGSTRLAIGDSLSRKVKYFKALLGLHEFLCTKCRPATPAPQPMLVTVLVLEVSSTDHPAMDRYPSPWDLSRKCNVSRALQRV
ncbi:hypothetical protein J6590_011780 [Homalodisca vitripennis]|nr:hypothetical protein J6590_011780 [Homalodisca vitripennis]